jgi:hypothetical protein
MGKSKEVAVMIKERIYLTDITLHTLDHQQTVNFSKVAQKGRIYFPISQESVKSTGSVGTESTVKLTFTFPKDLQERMDKGEVELMIPEGGLQVYVGKDVTNFLNSKNGKRVIRGLAKNKPVK